MIVEVLASVRPGRAFVFEPAKPLLRERARPSIQLSALLFDGTRTCDEHGHLGVFQRLSRKGLAMASERDKGATSSKVRETFHGTALPAGKDESKLDLRSSSDLRSKRLDRNHAKRLVQDILHHGSVSYTGHCMDELANDAMDIVDAVNVLRCGKIEREPEPSAKFGAWRYQVETNRMVVVIEIHSKTTVRVITAWRKKKR